MSAGPRKGDAVASDYSQTNTGFFFESPSEPIGKPYGGPANFPPESGARPGETLGAAYAPRMNHPTAGMVGPVSPKPNQLMQSVLGRAGGTELTYPGYGLGRGQAIRSGSEEIAGTISATHTPWNAAEGDPSDFSRYISVGSSRSPQGRQASNFAAGAADAAQGNAAPSEPGVGDSYYGVDGAAQFYYGVKDAP